MSQLVRIHRWSLVVICLAAGALALTGPAAALAATQPTTKAKVACGRPSHKLIHCRMALKQGAGISGTLTMRITQGGRVVAVGHGRVSCGRATLVMRLRRKMTPGRYTVSMVLTLRARMVLRLR